MWTLRDVHFEAALRTAVDWFQPGFQLKEKQLECLFNLFKGNDVVANLPTGYGKSLIYQLLPKLLSVSPASCGSVVVVSPLNLIQFDQLLSLGKRGILSCRLDVDCQVSDNTGSTASIDEVIAGKYPIIMCHPEALFHTQKGKNLLDSPRFRKTVVALAVDECHKVKDW